MSAMNLKNMAVLPSDQAHYFPYIGADPCNVSTGFRAHVNSSMHPFKFALADQPSYCLGYGATRSKLRKAADAEGLPLGKRLTRCAMRVDTDRAKSVLDIAALISIE